MNLNDSTLNKPDESCLSSSELKNLEKSFKKEFAKLFKERKLSLEEYELLEKFLYSKRLSKEVLKKIYLINNSVRYYVTGRRIITLLSKLNSNDIFYSKSIVVLTILREWHGILELCCVSNINENEVQNSLEKTFNILEKYNVPIKFRLYLIDDFMSKDYFYDKKDTMLNKAIDKLIALYKNEISQHLKELSQEGRMFILEYIWKEKSEENLYILMNNFGDSSKQVRNKIVNLLKDDHEYFKYIKGKLLSKNPLEREVAINIMLKWKTKESLEALKNISKIEKQQKLSNLIIGALKETSTLIEETLPIKDLIKHLLFISKSKKCTLNWIDFSSMPKVRFSSNEEEDYCENKYLQSLLLCYSSTNLIGISKDGSRLAEKLNKSDLAMFSNKLIDLFITDKIMPDRKWVLAFSCIYGDKKTIKKIKKYIEIWSNELRWNLMKDAIFSLMLSKSVEAFIIVDNIEKKCKYKQVKKAAHDSWEFAAKEMNVSKEVLFDLSVPNFNFNKDNKRTFDYGTRKFDVILNDKLTLEVYECYKKRKLKTLPAVSKNDDLEKAHKSYKDFKILKKQILGIIEIQSVRLEEALKSGRKWTKNLWIKIFEYNPIMRALGKGLIWGIYYKDELKYAYSSIDTSVNELITEEDSINYNIGLVHPIELTTAEINYWKDKLNSNKINPFINQLNRSIFKADESEQGLYKKEFDLVKKDYKSFIKDMSALRWEKGKISEGRYNSLYKKYDHYDIAIELNFNGPYLDNTIEIKEVKFYKINTDTCHENIYDNIVKENLLQLKCVPKRIFCEALNEINFIIDGQNILENLKV